MLWYMPLEPYEQRYTSQLSAANDGWNERNWTRMGISYRRIEGRSYRPTILHGSVVDAVGRSIWAMSQVEQFLIAIDHQQVSSDDIVYFDDFWHPGIEAIRYACDVMGIICPRMYAYCWAQSFDQYDFTFKMRSWIRKYERSNAQLFTKVFVANTMLKDLMEDLDIPCDVEVVGLPFDSDEVRCRMPYERLPRKNQVVFSSRWDSEKRPDKFLRIMDMVVSDEPLTQFVICSGSPKLTSNSSTLVQMLEYYKGKYPNNLIVREGLSKKDYYEILASSKVQVNTALQDWVSFTLLEASVAGCWPVYPNFRSFPETLQKQPIFLYDDDKTAATMIVAALRSETIFHPDVIKQREWIHKRFDSTWARILYHMGQIGDSIAADWQLQLNPYQQ